jgi:hypothetical protein
MSADGKSGQTILNYFLGRVLTAKDTNHTKKESPERRRAREVFGNSPAIDGWGGGGGNKKSRQGRKKGSTILPSLTGLVRLAIHEPSHKWLGYFQNVERRAVWRWLRAGSGKPARGDGKRFQLGDGGHFFSAVGAESL